MLILSQDKKIALPYGHFILKVIHTKDLETDKWKVEDSIYPWAVIALTGREDCEILGQYETLEQASLVLDAICSMGDKSLKLPTVEHLKMNLSENSDN